METTSTKLGAHAIRMSGPSTGRWLGAVMTIGLLILVSGGSARGQSQELQSLSAQLAQKITSSGKKSVAVVDFTDLQGNVTELGRFLAEELSDSLAEQANGFRVIDRTYLKAILREHKLDATGLIDPATASKLGQISGVQGLITGTIVPLGDNVSLSVKVLDAATETIIAATTAQIPMTPAISALLKSEISPGGGNEGESRSHGQEGPTTETSSASAQPSQSVVGTYRGANVTLAIRRCQKRGPALKCLGNVTDTSDGELSFSLEPNNTYLLDNLGNQYDVNYWQGGLKVGAQGDSQNIEPGLPINFTLAIDNAKSAATSVSVVLQYTTYNRQNGHGGRFTATFRHIPIEGR